MCARGSTLPVYFLGGDGQQGGIDRPAACGVHAVMVCAGGRISRSGGRVGEAAGFEHRERCGLLNAVAGKQEHTK